VSRGIENETRYALRLWLAALEHQRRSMIAALVKIDAEIATLRARPTSPRIVLDDGGKVDDTAFDDDDLGEDLGARARDEMS
jgi:hypothetical protein